MRITGGYPDRKEEPMGQCQGRSMAVGSEEQGTKKPNGWRGASKAESGSLL